jgi:hypothetical protein
MVPNPAIVNMFYDQVTIFLGELNEMYPDDPDFALGLTTLKMLRKVNPIAWVRLFYGGANLYESEILSNNETFFMDHSFENVQDMDFNLLIKLKQYVQGMSDSSKKVVWVYVTNLYKLAKIIST